MAATAVGFDDRSCVRRLDLMAIRVVGGEKEPFLPAARTVGQAGIVQSLIEMQPNPVHFEGRCCANATYRRIPVTIVKVSLALRCPSPCIHMHYVYMDTDLFV